MVAEPRGLPDPRGGAAGQLERQRTADLWDDTKSWRAPDGRRLSDRVWLARQTVRDRIDAEIRAAIARGDDPLALARRLEEYLLPEQRPRRDPRTGRLLPGQPRRIVTPTPRSGKGSYSARRLARTEVSRAYNQAAKLAAERNPFVRGLRYATSANHPKPDECDRAADHDEGMGRGVWPINECPMPPLHPHCRCTVAPAAMPRPDDVVRQLRREYGPDDPTPGPTPIRGPRALLERLVAGWRVLRELVA